MNQTRPQTRQIREHGQAEARPQLRLVHVRAQSAAASSPGQRAREQSVHVRGNDTSSTGHDLAVATDIDSSQADRDSELATATVEPLTGIERGNAQVKHCPIHGIAVDALPPISFPVHIRHISPYVLF
jgi:hypothetical protein